jgi:glucose-fructose oxidoreductase
MRPEIRRSRFVRYAVVGLGHIAQVAVLPAFAHARNSRLTALVSGDGDKLRVLGDRYGVNFRFGYDELDACFREVDAVYICTPNSEHASQAIRAARAGVHVLCEKPLAVTNAECQAILQARDIGGVQLMTAYRLHFDPLTLDILEQVRAGRIGEPRYFESSFSRMARTGGIRTRPGTGGGAVYDLGIYCINAARMLFETEPVLVSGRSVDGERSGMPGVDETTAAILHFADDRLATFTCSFASADASRYRVIGTEGEITVDPAFAYAEPLAYTMKIGTRSFRARGRKHDQFAAELQYFSQCILNGHAPEPSGEEGAWDVRIINAILDSTRQATQVALPPFSDAGPAAGQATSLPPTRKPQTVHVEEPHV